ncbi:MAG: lamin tail domain-containing protein [Nanoarchaeota archaeon]|nr:lamin tail domain-containing protein [Nanoarchaeota archaeon]
MANKNIFLLIGILVLLLPNISAVVINEIMYAPTQSEYYNEWIEIYNDGNLNIDLNNWTLCGDGLSAGYIDHADAKLKLNNSIILPPEGYAIITDGGSGTEVYSNFIVNGNSLALHTSGSTLCGELVNSGETISLKDNSGNTINSITYDSNIGAKDDGNSLQLCNVVWTAASPTTGSTNSCATNQTQTANNQTITTNETTTTKTAEISNLSIGVNYPEKVSLNQEFIFKIKLINFDEGIYDVKIDILSNENRISEILNENVWKSTSYYVNDIISPNTEKEFTMKITQEFENAEITIKIKDSSDKTKIFSGYLISKSNETIDEIEEGSIYQNPIENGKPNENGTIIISGSATANAEDIKSGENTEKLNKNDYAKYILIVFAFLLALLFLLKRKIFKKEYKNEFKE